MQLEVKCTGFTVGVLEISNARAKGSSRRNDRCARTIERGGLLSAIRASRPKFLGRWTNPIAPFSSERTALDTVDTVGRSFGTPCTAMGCSVDPVAIIEVDDDCGTSVRAPDARDTVPVSSRVATFRCDGGRLPVDVFTSVGVRGVGVPVFCWRDGSTLEAARSARGHCRTPRSWSVSGLRPFESRFRSRRV